MCILFDAPSLPAADRIKQYVFEIHRHLESLVELTKKVGDDTGIIAKIHEFYGEVLFDFVTRFSESYQKLPAIEIPPPQIFSAPADESPKKAALAAPQPVH